MGTETEFKDISYAELSVFVDKLHKQVNSIRIDTHLFMVLDKESEEDRKVVLIHETSRALYAMLDYVGTDREDVRYEGVDDILWRKHRIPFEKAAFFWLLTGGQPSDEGDEFLQSTRIRTIEGL